MPLLDTLLTLDRQLGAGDGDTYRRLLRDDAVVIVPASGSTRPTAAGA